MYALACPDRFTIDIYPGFSFYARIKPSAAGNTVIAKTTFGKAGNARLSAGCH